MIETVTVRRLRGGVWEEIEDAVADEAPLEIAIDGRAFALALRTPGHDEELAVGYLVSEGVLHRREQVARITTRGERIDVALTADAAVDWEKLRRSGALTSACGLCGKESLAGLRAESRFAHRKGEPVFQAETLHRLPDALRAAQPAFDQTGGLHAAGLFAPDGTLLRLREDVGRHNAVDKIVGRALLDNELPCDRHLLLVSGRVSFELVQKATQAGIPALAAIGAPSSLAVGLARETDTTLIGFLRPDRMSIYAGAWRVENDER